MKTEFSGIERRLERLSNCLNKLEPFRAKTKAELTDDPYLQDIVERNLEVAAQAVIDIANRIISIEELEKPRDYFEAILRLGQVDILPVEFANHMAPIAGFRNVLVYEYMDIDWDEVYSNLQQLQDIYTFMDNIKTWLSQQAQSSS